MPVQPRPREISGSNSGRLHIVVRCFGFDSRSTIPCVSYSLADNGSEGLYIYALHDNPLNDSIILREVMATAVTTCGLARRMAHQSLNHRVSGIGRAQLVREEVSEAVVTLRFHRAHVFPRPASPPLAPRARVFFLLGTEGKLWEKPRPLGLALCLYELQEAEINKFVMDRNISPDAPFFRWTCHPQRRRA